MIVIVLDRFKVRAAEISDLPSICEVERASFVNDAYPSFLLEKLILCCNSVFFVLTDLERRIIGYCVSKNERTRSHLISLAVLPACRGSGVASLLVKQLLVTLRKCAIKEIRLEVRTDNDPAIQLYRRLGFTKVSVIQSYYSDGSAAYQMRKILE